MNDGVDDSDSNASEEGAVFRGLFQSESESSFDDDNGAKAAKLLDDDSLREGRNHHGVNEKDTNRVSAMYKTSTMMNVQICQRQVGASIANKLWPAAEYLATFIMDLSGTNHSESSRTSVTGEEETRTTRRTKDQSSETWQRVEEMLRNKNDKSVPLQVIELGAGIGLTGLQIATCLPCHVILTDLEEALELLQINTDLNRHEFALGPHAVQVQRLAWGNDTKNVDTALKSLGTNLQQHPVLVLASDCVYFEALHEPLEWTLWSLLSRLPPKSLCLMAGARRWKRDNAFYTKKLGQKTKTRTHKLQCILLQETVTRREQRRDIMRVYCIEWVRIG